LYEKNIIVSIQKYSPNPKNKNRVPEDKNIVENVPMINSLERLLSFFLYVT
jgi:hypothetical protein